jgi:hypothetical protein
MSLARSIASLLSGGGGVLLPSNNLSDVANAATALSNLGGVPNTSQLAGNRNKIINGSFPIWQRGTSFTSTGVNEYSADRFRTEGFSTSTTISQQTFTAGQTDVPGAPQYYCRVQVTGTPGGSYWSFQQRIEAPQNIGYGTATYTLSFYAKAVSGTITANTFTYGLNGTRTGNPTLTTSWQRITTTIANATPSGSYSTVDLVYITNAVSSLAVDIANVQLELGATATPFENRIYSDELAMCQRYFYRTPSTGVVSCNTDGNGRTIPVWKMPVTMRSAPTVTSTRTNSRGYDGFMVIPTGNSSTGTNLSFTFTVAVDQNPDFVPAMYYGSATNWAGGYLYIGQDSYLSFNSEM